MLYVDRAANNFAVAAQKTVKERIGRHRFTIAKFHPHNLVTIRNCPVP